MMVEQLEQTHNADGRQEIERFIVSDLNLRQYPRCVEPEGRCKRTVVVVVSSARQIGMTCLLG